MDGNWFAASNEQLIVGLAQQFTRARAGSGQYHQTLAIWQWGRPPDDLPQFRVAAHKLVPIDSGKYALLSHQLLLRLGGG
jgi:hypothetical protein